MSRLAEYDGSLDNIDPIELGKNLRIENKDPYDENDPTDNFTGGRDDDPRWDFLQNFRENIMTGWRRQDQLIAKNKYLEQLPEFQKNLPNIGDEVYIENPSNLNNYYLCRIEFIPEAKDKVLVLYLDKDAAYGQTNLSLAEYCYSAKYKHGIFPRFYTNKPE